MLTHILLLLSIYVSTGTSTGTRYEVWLSDQSNSQGITESSPNGTHGGFIYVYPDTVVEGKESSRSKNKVLKLDVGLLFSNSLEKTGSLVSRLHGILPNPDTSFMTANFLSGHLGIINGQTKKPVCLFRVTGTSTGRQNHMAFWSVNGDYIFIANQNGRMLERINVVRDKVSNQIVGFDYDAFASFDFVGGSGRILQQPIAVDMNLTDNIFCIKSGLVYDNQELTTPLGNLKQEAGVRPTNNVVCPIPTSTNHIFATLSGGGMLVLDGNEMKIVAEYSRDAVRAAGCGGIEADGFVYINSGSPGAGISEFTIYRFRLSEFVVAPNFHSKQNTPVPTAGFKDEDNGKTLPVNRNRDAHGMVITGKNSLKYLYQFDRIQNVVEVFHLTSPWDRFHHLETISLTDSGVCGTTPGATKVNDPTPDLAWPSPDGSLIFVALRGPIPLTVAHAAEGSCPGLGVIKVESGDKNGLIRAFPVENFNRAGTENLSDPHATVVRIIQEKETQKNFF